MKKNVKKHTDGVWYYAVVRWDGYGVFTSWDRAREECDGYSDNKKKKFKTFEEAKVYAEDEYRKLHGVESACYVEEIEWLQTVIWKNWEKNLKIFGRLHYRIKRLWIILKSCYQ